MKNKKILILIIAVSVILIATIVFRFISYENYSNLDIIKVTYSYGGGYGTEADTATKTITINSDGSVIFTNSYNSLTKDVNISSSDYEKLTNFIKKKMSLFNSIIITEDDVYDGTSSHITIESKEGKTYEVGGYMVSNKKYKEIKNMIMDTVGVETFREYVNSITKNAYDINKNIVEVIYSYGGGFGTELDTASKYISISSNGTAKLTNSYNLYEKIIDIDQNKYSNLVDYINSHKSIFNGVNESNDIMDGLSSSLVIKTDDGKTYEVGGYMVDDEDYDEIVRMIYDIVNREVFEEYVNSIK